MKVLFEEGHRTITEKGRLFTINKEHYFHSPNAAVLKLVELSGLTSDHIIKNFNYVPELWIEYDEYLRKKKVWDKALERQS